MALTEIRIRNCWACLTPLFLVLVSPIARVRRLRAEWQRRRIYRSDLNRLLGVGEYIIRDIGLTLDDARREIQKPLWRR
jgi:uncharacterized protein YjiS (DUF1127 family)